MKMQYKELISKRAKDLEELSESEIQLLAEIYKHYAVRKEISTSNKMINSIFNHERTNMPKSSDIKYFYNIFNESFYGTSLQEYLYIADEYQADSPDEDFSDCISYKNRYSETPEYLNSLTDEEFDELIEKNKDNALRQAALILCSSRPKERLVDRAPLDLKIAYANMQNYFIQLYKEQSANKKHVDIYSLIRESGRLAREHSQYGCKHSYKYANDKTHEYEDCVFGERIDFTQTPITILSLYDQYLKQDSQYISNLKEEDYKEIFEAFAKEYLLTNKQKETFKEFYGEGELMNIQHYLYYQSVDCANEVKRIRERNKGVANIKFSDEDKEYGNED